MKKVLISLGIVVGSALGLSSCSLISVTPASMDGMMMEHGNSKYSPTDLMFAQMMVPHHQQALTMAELAQTRAENPQVRDIASRIRSEQSPEIDQMKTWLAESGVSENDLMNMPMEGMLTDEELSHLKSISGHAFDVLYLQDMIKHHQGAIAMVSMIRNSKNPEVKTFGESIVSSQTVEISEMQKMLSELE